MPRADNPDMNSVASIALSGLNASQVGLGVSAHNVANALTPGFRRQEAVAATQAGGGVQTTVRRLPESGSDLAADLVAQKMASYSFKANLRVLQTADHMMGSLLDVMA